jgi:hypothetical protein
MRVLAGLIVLLAWSSSTHADALVPPSGGIRGRVTDPVTGRPIADAVVVVEGGAQAGSQATLTDDAGEYLVTALSPGTYAVTVYSQDTKVGSSVLVQVGKVSWLALRVPQVNAVPPLITPVMTPILLRGAGGRAHPTTSYALLEPMTWYEARSCQRRENEARCWREALPVRTSADLQ